MQVLMLLFHAIPKAAAKSPVASDMASVCMEVNLPGNWFQTRTNMTNIDKSLQIMKMHLAQRLLRDLRLSRLFRPFIMLQI
jgi:hypothetical protein